MMKRSRKEKTGTWTEPQWDAIEEYGKNIMVSAGAGSGKTAVLSERVLEYCLDGNDIRKILVLTFTNPAALEMKERIRKKLIENNLLDQASLIDASYITTFDSYALSFLKKYGYLIGVSKSVSVVSEAIINIKRDEFIDELFKEYILNDNELFYKALEYYTKKSPDILKEYIIGIYNQLMLKIDIDEYFNTYKQNYMYEGFELNIFNNYYNNEILPKLEEYKSLISEIYDIISPLKATMPKSKYPFDTLYKNLSPQIDIINNNPDYNDYSYLFLNNKTSRNKKDFDERIVLLNNKSTKLFKELKEYFSKFPNKEKTINDIKPTELSFFLLEIAYMVVKKVYEYEFSIQKFVFSDIARMALNILNTHPDVCDELKYYYNEILVDEYQDTSDMQEGFLLKIANNNLYMVGDIKQSIYRFRNANPYIFKEKYINYSNNNGGIKIDLTNNFRSRDEVLDSINRIFNKSMTIEYGDADYVNSHQMIFGQKDYLKLKQDINFDTNILCYQSKYYEDIPDYLAEAFIIANDIKNKMSDNRRVLRKGFVDIDYNSFAIIVRDSSYFTVYKDVLEYYNIPAYIDAQENLLESSLPILFSNILGIINCIRNKDYSLDFKHMITSIARSFLYNYDDELIYNMIINREKTQLLSDMYYFSNMKDISLQMLFYEICNKLEIYKKLLITSMVEEGVLILDQINLILKGFDDCNIGLNLACTYLSKQFSGENKLKYDPQKAVANAVRIMTIHHSKGLEYAYCYFPFLYSNFKYDSAKVSLDNDYGMIIPSADEGGIAKTLLDYLKSKRERIQTISEQIRLFYVALTRAREQIILLWPYKYDEKKDEVIYSKNLNDISGINSFIDILDYANVLDYYKVDIDLDDLTITRDVETASEYKFNGDLILEYEDVIKKEEINNIRISKRLHQLPDKSKDRAIDLGLEFHRYLELLDLNTLNINELNIKDEFIKENIEEVLKLSVFNNIKEAKAYKEYEFVFIDNDNEYHGIIDLLLIYDDHIEIIDYKLDKTKDKAYINQLSIYKKYISTLFDRRIDCYLLSILHHELIKLDI